MKKTTMKLKLLSTSLVIAMLFGQTAFVNANNTQQSQQALAQRVFKAARVRQLQNHWHLGFHWENNRM